MDGAAINIKSKRIGVLMGGPSAEREVSLKTGAGVLRALETRGYTAIAIDWTGGGTLMDHLRSERIEAVWNALHGALGEDGCVQGLLECARIPYTGSGVLASALAMDKVASKRIFDHFSIPTPAWAVYRSPRDAEQIGFPLVVKPSHEGSSVGVSILQDPAALDGAIASARKFHGDVLLERYIPGREIQAGILDDEVLGTVEVRPAAAFYDYEAKYNRSDTDYLLPAPLPKALEERVCDLTLRAHQALGCSGHSRTDLRLSDEDQAYVLEVNTLPGMTTTSLLPKIARHAGLSYEDLVERVLASARLYT